MAPYLTPEWGDITANVGGYPSAAGANRPSGHAWCNCSEV